jgi:DNA-binding transcriptional ArsR family regulator
MGMDLFGSRTRTRILMYLALAEESYVAEMVSVLGDSQLTVQRILRDLEELGVVASRLRGRVRLVSLDKTWYAAAELRALLQRMSAGDASVLDAAASVRRRPRRPGKPL